MEQQEKTEQALSAKKVKEMKKAEKRKQKEAKKEQKAKNPGKKRKKAPVIIAAIIIVLIVIRMVSCAFSGNAGVMVSTTNAFRGDIEENVSTSGKVASEEKTVLFAPVSGRLSEINVAAGDAVKAGDVLMTYDMDQMEQRLQEASLQQDKSNASYKTYTYGRLNSDVFGICVAVEKEQDALSTPQILCAIHLNRRSPSAAP